MSGRHECSSVWRRILHVVDVTAAVPDPARGGLIDLPKAPDAIELRHLRALVAVAEELNFSRAAERLFITQPALSRQIRALERLLGVDLLRRSTHQVELTVAGEALLNRARPMLADLDEAVVRTRSLGGEHQQRLARLTQPVIDQLLVGLDPFREAFEAMNAKFPCPDSVSAWPVNAGGVASLVYGEQPNTAPTLMYVHGGGYLVGSAYGSRPLAGALAVAAQQAVLVPDYRLAPEHPYPAAVDDITAAFAWLSGRGTSTGQLTLVADSSGAGLVMSLLQRLKASADPLPRRVVLLSPWVDLECRFLDDETDADPQALAVRDQVDMCVPTYLHGHPVDDPAVNALYADLTGLPPMLVQAGTGDFVLRDARELVARARRHGVDARLELYPVNTHVFHLFWSFLPEAAKAIERVGSYITASLTAATATASDEEAG
jgi:acetyl esterase/lipase